MNRLLNSKARYTLRIVVDYSGSNFANPGGFKLFETNGRFAGLCHQDMNAHHAKPVLNPAFKAFQSLPSLLQLLKLRGNGSNEFPKRNEDKRLSPDAERQNVVDSNRYARTLH